MAVKSSAIKCYSTSPIHNDDQGFRHSRVIMAAFSEGCKGQVVPPTKLFDGVAAMYGILRGTAEIIRQCEWVGRDYYYIDHGYLKPGHYDGYYRITRNARQAEVADPREYIYPPDRLKKVGVEIRPWRRTGKNILVIPITGAIGEFYGINSDQWLRVVTDEITSHTARPIEVKYKGLGAIEEALKDTWCVVTHSSNTAVDALVNGVPVITLGESACELMSWDFGDIECPHWPERELWLQALAYHQFTLTEMRNGTAWKILNYERGNA